MTDHIFGGEKKGSITDIPLPHSKSSETLDLSDSRSDSEENEEHDVSDWNSMKNKNKRMKLKLGIIGVIIIIILLILSVVLHGADVTIDPREERVYVNESITAVATNTEE